MLKKKWKKFCIVGFGNHVIEKIIPALEKEKKSIVGIVSSKKKRSNILNLTLLMNL